MNAAAPKNELAPVSAAPPSVLNIIERAARDESVDVAKLEKLLEMQERVDARQNQQAFNRAMSEAQSEMMQVVRDGDNPHSRSKYARLEAIDKAIRPIYTSHGFSVRYRGGEPSIPGGVKVICVVSHAQGHTEEFPLEAPADSVGSKGVTNKPMVQAVGSTVTYLRRYALMMAFNVTLTNDPDDDDGEATRGRSASHQQHSSVPAAPWSAWLNDVTDTLAAEPDGAKWLAVLKHFLAGAPSKDAIGGLRESRAIEVAIANAPQRVAKDIMDLFTKATAKFDAPAAAKPEAKQAPAFDAAIIDEFGEIASDQFTDATAFARALISHWRKMDQALTGEFMGHNSDAIDVLEKDFPSAFALLSEIELAADGGDEPTSEPVQFAVVAAPGRDGKPDWKKYPEAIADALDSPIVANELPQWTMAQRETLAEAPAQYRMPAVKAIVAALAARNMSPPPFLAEIIKPKPKADAPSPPSPSEGEGDESRMTPDQKWAAGHVAEIDALAKKPPAEALKAIKDLAAMLTTRSVMRRLRTEGSDGNRESQRLFDMVDAHYQAVIGELEGKSP